ncbi:MAG: serine hydrolase [Chloroflexi bacterium]|nr:serine hydrolase [Chloroflexota bacterium]
MTHSIAPQPYYPPPESRGGWRTNTDPAFLRSLGLDPDGIRALLEWNVAIPAAPWEPYDRYAASLVIKDGWLVGEAYNVPAARTFRQYLASNGKAFSIGLFGLLVEEGAAGRARHAVDLASPLYDRRWLPEGWPLSDPRKAAITFEQVFTHSTGILPEDREQERNNPAVADFVAYTLGHDAAHPEARDLYYDPGHPERYAGSAYSSVAFNHLAMVLPHLTGLPAHRALEERLLAPLGIEAPDYNISPAWNPPGPGNRWAPCGALRLAPRDYARYAYLLLRDGAWQGQSLIPQGYLRRFTRGVDAPNTLSNAAGAFGPQYPRDMFRIAGSGLSMAFMVPSHDLIWLRTSRAPNERRDEVVSRSLEMLFAALA